MRARWSLDPSVVFLNHGSFGACPTEILAEQSTLRARLEKEPVQFFVHALEPLLDAARAALAGFVGADADDLAFVGNASTGASTVLRSLQFQPGDELLTTDHAYNACRNALEYVATRSGARIVVARVPFPLKTEDDILDPILALAGAKTKLALLDHVTSPTALIFPIAKLVAALQKRGIDTLVDGAHAPGMLKLDLRALGAAYYTGNCHKWLCAPKGAAFLHVRRDRQDAIRPLTTSHGANSPRTDRSRFRLEFDWTGTGDPTPFLCVPSAIRTLGALLPGGWPALLARNHENAVTARDLLSDALGIPPPCPDSMLGSMASVPLSDAPSVVRAGAIDVMSSTLFERHRIEVPVFAWPKSPKRVLRVSTPAYATRTDVDALVRALGDV